MLIQSYRFNEISKLIYPIKFIGVALLFQMKLLREVTWQILSHCDGWAVKKLIEKEERPAATVLRMCSERIFEKNVKEIFVWKTCYQICRDAYLSMKPEFEIRTDKLGEYCLVYVSHVVRSEGYIFKNSPVGSQNPFHLILKIYPLLHDPHQGRKCFSWAPSGSSIQIAILIVSSSLPASMILFGFGPGGNLNPEMKLM